VPRNQEKYRENSARKSYDGHRILDAELDSPEFLAATVHVLSTKSSCDAAVSATTTIVATLSAVLPPIAGNSVNPATATNSINFATTTRQFIKARIKLKISELKGLAVFRDNHTNFRRVSYGIRN
jgi:hypothetical protein